LVLTGQAPSRAGSRDTRLLVPPLLAMNRQPTEHAQNVVVSLLIRDIGFNDWSAPRADSCHQFAKRPKPHLGSRKPDSVCISQRCPEHVPDTSRLSPSSTTSILVPPNYSSGFHLPRRVARSSILPSCHEPGRNSPSPCYRQLPIREESDFYKRDATYTTLILEHFTNTNLHARAES